MRAGPTIRPRKTAAHVCSLPPCFTASRSAGILPANWTLPSRANGESNLNGERQPCQLEAGATESRRARRDFLIATPVRIESGSISLKAKEKTFSNSNKKLILGATRSHLVFAPSGGRIPPRWAGGRASYRGIRDEKESGGSRFACGCCFACRSRAAWGSGNIADCYSCIGRGDAIANCSIFVCDPRAGNPGGQPRTPFVGADALSGFVSICCGSQD